MTVVPLTFTVASTSTPQSVAGQPAAPSATPAQGSVPQPSPTLERREVVPTPDRQAKEERSNYILFGVLLAVLMGVIVVILFQRRG
jgi:hypothetical protein